MVSYHLNLVVAVITEFVETYEDGLSELAHVLDMSVHVRESFADAFGGSFADFVHRNVAVHFQSAQGRYEYGQ